MTLLTILEVWPSKVCLFKNVIRSCEAIRLNLLLLFFISQPLFYFFELGELQSI